jgi:dihydroorotate dehydrogenase
MYRFVIRPFLFLFPPEFVHHATCRLIRALTLIPGMAALLRWYYRVEHKSLERKVFGLTFSNPVGLAAGFDKNAALIDPLACLGFGFIEIGTVTPRAQAGNDKPRLFRLPHDQALINRMGFNNEGVEAAVQRLRKRRSAVIVGGNIGKNKTTPNEHATRDYEICFEALYPYVDYFVVNVSSPNTPGLRELQEKEPLARLLHHIKALSLARPQPKPVLLKIAPDLTDTQLLDVVDVLRQTHIDGVIATNTTVSRNGLITPAADVDAMGTGGLSGAPLRQRATEAVKFLRQHLGKDFPIVAVGGIMNAADAMEKFQAGANLVQLYTGFIYEGPGVVRKINKRLLGSAPM